ncbi:MAG: 1-acyl-sn-glycerol-3-phosphate acyltransferase [Verrucomicrobia bacterium]|nr:1-acyl-sn-glycerol-3-phosphate acyltransferase [Verrucomicrobiota bacterium]
MQNVVIAKPYRFVAPHRGKLWWRLFRPILPFYLRKTAGIVQVECRQVERLRASLDAGHGIMLVPNHCRPPDPMVLGILSDQLAQPLYVIASWHLFMQNAFQSFLLPRLGVFSIYREGTDREALKCAMQVTAAADRPLVIFPEGVISRHNDKLNNLMEGTALMARGAAKERARLNPPGKVVVHPVAIRYFFDGDVRAAVEPVLRDVERRLTWQPQHDLSLEARIEKIGKALLAMKEIEYFGAAQEGALGDRLQKLIDRLLVPLEAEWLKGRREKDIVQRVKLLRIAIVPDMAAGALEEAELQRRWRQLADIYLAQQIAFYPVGYWGENPTPERLLETVEKFEEDLTDAARVHAPMRAVVDVGEAIEVSPERARGADGDPLMGAIREQLEAMLAASLAERRPASAQAQTA